MLVHVGCEDRRTSGQRVAMVRGPLIDQLAVTRGPGQQNPTRTAAERLAHCDKFRTPALMGAKVVCQRLPQRRARFTFSTQAVKEQFVQDHRIRGYELLALEAVQKKSGR